jgi:uncharacterized membrane protein/predicted DsbA family dithiol-disulfide isomerase
MNFAITPQREIRPLPYGVYSGTVVVLCIAGFAISAYLAVSHYRLYTDVSYQSFCALTKAINCDTVSQSSYAVFGRLPVAVWGMAGYALLLLLSLAAGSPSARPDRLWTIGLVLVLCYSTVSIFLALISALRIKSYCILCIASYGVNFLLVFFVWVIRRRFHAGPIWAALAADLGFLREQRRFYLAPCAVFVIAVASAYLAFPTYWRVAAPVASAPIPSGLTAEGHPWIGAEEPQVEITEFSDYQCFQCRKMHYFLRRLVAQHPRTLRLVHRNFPLDHEFNPIVKTPLHIGSGRMALIGIHAAQTRKFWETNDRLFEAAAAGETILLPKLAAETGLDGRELAAALEHPPYRQLLMRDIHQGIKHGIAVTPSYMICGAIHPGGIPSEILKSLIEKGDRR